MAPCSTAGRKGGPAGFVRCLPNGCVAEVVMDDKCSAAVGGEDDDVHFRDAGRGDRVSAQSERDWGEV